jgi:histone deacetylase 6
MNGPNGGEQAPQMNKSNPGPSPSLPPNAPVNPPQPSDGSMQNGQLTLPVGDTNAAAFLALQNAPKPNPLPFSSLRTGFCYDIRMRFHQTVDYRDPHIEDPRRIYRIYKELALAGLIEDRESQTVSKDELMMRLRARYATEEEILLVHSKEHLLEMQATESTASPWKYVLT